MPAEVPAGAVKVIERLEEAGHEAYFVGGCVRDLLLGREVNDWDITTGAAPSEVKSLFSRTIDTGIQHGTVTVASCGGYYEVTTYRIDGEYLDGRHPSSVRFTPSLEEDLKRRDFTINAMAWHPQKGLVDLFCGREDLSRRVIRCVGRAQDRFGEDALRMMRALRFAAQLDFSLDPAAAEAIRQGAGSISRVSRERIQAELVKLICSDHPGWLREMADLGLSADFLPELSGLPGPERESRIRACENVPPEKHLRLAALWLSSYASSEEAGACRGCKTAGTKNAGSEQTPYPALPEKDRRLSAAAEAELDGLRFDNDTKQKVLLLLEWSGAFPFPQELSGKEEAARTRYLMGELGALFEDELKLMEAAGRGSQERLRDLARAVREKGECTSVKELAVTGRDLIAAGIPAGKQLGECLKYLLGRVLYEPEMNTKERLTDEALRWYQ